MYGIYPFFVAFFASGYEFFVFEIIDIFKNYSYILWRLAPIIMNAEQEIKAKMSEAR